MKPTRFRPGVDVFPLRKHYEDEFDLIRTIQEPLQRLTPKNWDDLKEIIFFQRDLRPVDPGKCSIFPEEDRAPKALPISQQFRFLQEATNLKIIEIGETERPLNAEQRERTFHVLASQASVSFDSLRKKLNLPSDSTFNLEDSKRKKLEGDQTAAVLRRTALFGKEWDRKDTDEQSEIVKTLLTREERDEVEKLLIEKLDLCATTARAVASARLPQGYSNLSEKAMKAILPHLRNGRRYFEAVEQAFPDNVHNKAGPGQRVDRLPYYPALLERHVSRGTNNPNHEIFTRLGKIANPTVHIGLNQVRRVVNAIISKYGQPNRIMVELARDLKNSAEEKQAIDKRQSEEKRNNDRRKQDLKNCNVEASHENLRKLRLWDEQGPSQARCCPYCGKVLSLEAVLDYRTQIDHILPFSRTLDDSLSTKVVC